MRKILIALLLILAAPAALQAQLELTDFVLPAGRQALVLALFESGGTSGNGIYRDGSSGTFLGGDLEVKPGLTINRIRIQTTGQQIVLNRSGTENFSDTFGYRGVSATYDDWQWTLQTQSQIKTWSQDDVFGNSAMGGGFGRIRDGQNDAGLQSSLTTSGERFLLAITVPAPMDNCNLYLGSTDFTRPGDFRLGALTPMRMYLGSNLVCGDAP